MKAQQAAAAELLRIEMMHSSLSLSGIDAEAPPPSGLAGLETFLSGLAGQCQLVPAGKAAPAGAPHGDAALLSELTEADAPATATKGGDIEKTAEEFLGTPYRFGGEGPKGIDCSSFVQQVFREHQIDLPRTAREQSGVGSDVAQGDLKKGDLIFFHTYASYPSHVGIYLGDGKMIHASSAKGEVTVSDINSDYYRSHFMGAKRIG